MYLLTLFTNGYRRTHPYLIKYFILVLVRPIEQSIYWLHRATAAAGASTSCAWFGEFANFFAPITDNLRGAAAVHWDDVVDVVLHEIARLLLENGGKDG